MMWVSDVIASQSGMDKRKGCLNRIPSANTSFAFTFSLNQPAMSSNATSSSAIYNFTPGDWAWGSIDPSENREVKLNTPCLGYHSAANSNEDNVLLHLDRLYNDHRDVVPLPGKMEYRSFSKVGMVRSSQ